MRQATTHRDQWEEATLGERAYEVRDLYEPAQEAPRPYLGLEHIEKQTLRMKEIGDSSNTVSTKKIFKRGDILFGSLRPYFRKVVRPRFDGVCSTDITVIRARANADQTFLYYLVASQEFIDHATNISLGTRMPRASWKVLENSVWLFPPLDDQRKIAAILSAYDDLTENDLRRIRILEEMAQLLYLEWFVKFRFPGHERVKMVESELGPIPEGWEVLRLSAMCEIVDGDWIETKDQGGNDYRLLQVSNIGVNEFVETGNYRYITQETFDRLRCQEVRPGDILISRMPDPIGRAWLVTGMPWRMITAIDVAIARASSDRADPYFLVSYLNSRKHLDLCAKQASGTTRPRISRRDLCDLPMVAPPLEVQHDFRAVVEDTYGLSSTLGRHTSNLHSQRDLLLPRLISGNLDVSDLDINREVLDSCPGN
jgi:type I restriction enzyme S subunit